MSRFDSAIEAAAQGYNKFPQNYLELTAREKHKVRIGSAVDAYLDAMLDEETLAEVLRESRSTEVVYENGHVGPGFAGHHAQATAVVAYLKGGQQ